MNDHTLCDACDKDSMMRGEIARELLVIECSESQGRMFR